MPKFNGQNKKRIDPRYFMDEKLEETISDEEGMARASALAQQGIEKVKNELPNAHQGSEGRMHRTHLAQLISDATMLLDLFDDSTDLPEWLESKITLGSDYIRSAVSYLSGERSREAGRLADKDTLPPWTKTSSGPSNSEIDYRTYGAEGHPYDSGKA